MLHSTVARNVRWRSGRSAGPVPRASRLPSEPSEQCIRAPAVGREPRRARWRAAGRRGAGRSRPRRARCPRSGRSRGGRPGLDRRTAARRATRPAPRSAGGSRTRAPSGGRPGTRARRASRSTVRLVARILSPGQRARSWSSSGATPTTCSRLSSTSRVGVSANVLGHDVQRRARALDGRAQRGRDAGEHQLGLGDRSERHERRALRVAIVQVRAHGDRQPRLADAAGTGEGDQPHLRRLEQLRDLVDVAARARSATSRSPAANAGPAGRCSTPRTPNDPRRCPAAANRSLRSTARSSRTSRPSSRGVRNDRYESVPCAWSSSIMAVSRASRSGAGVLTYSRRGIERGEPELVLQARDVHVRPDPAVPLPVQADEDVGLRQVGPIQLPRRVRSGPELEHHRREPERRRWRGPPRRAPRPARPASSSRRRADAGPGSGSRRRRLLLRHASASRTIHRRILCAR